MRFAPTATVLLALALAVAVVLPSGGASLATTLSTRSTRSSAAAKATGAPLQSAKSVSTVAKKTTVSKKTTVAKKTTTKVKKTTKEKATRVTVKPDCLFIEVSPGHKIKACAVDGVATTAAATTAPVTTTTTTIAPAPTPTAPSVPVSVDPNAVVVPTTAVAGASQPTAAAGTTTTTIPTPFPAPATPALRVTAGGLDPYRGLGTWADVFDWTVQYGGAKPKFTIATVDAIAAAGVQTLYLQVSKWDSKSGDIPEIARLQPIIDRAHQIGLFVVAWYLPTLEDVNADLRRTVAAAQLDVDGISIDIETSRVKDIPTRNQRLVAYSAALRSLLSGRLVTGTVLPPVDTDSPTYKLWPKLPYGSIAPYYDGWIIMGYWTSWKIESGWRDGYRYTQENINRLRAYLGRADAPIHYAGGVGGSALTPWDVGGMIRAAQEGAILGASVYDWLVTDPTYWQYLWALRTAPDPRWTPVAAPLPPPTTTTSTTLPAPAPGGGATTPAAATTAPQGPATGGNANGSDVVVVATVPAGH